MPVSPFLIYYQCCEIVARSAVRRRSARVSEAVSPANNARVAIGLIVVKSVAKSLLILINRGDMNVKFGSSFIRMADQARGKVGLIPTS